MSKIQLLCFLFLFSVTILSAQKYTIKGRIQDGENGQALAGASILVKQPNTGLQIGQSSNSNGEFLVEVSSGDYTIMISFLGYDNYTGTITISHSSVDLGKINLKLKDQELQEVEVSGLMMRQDLRGDTTIYFADAFKVNPDATTEDLIKKMPGISVDGNTVKAGGQEVKKVLVNGKEFFGNDPMMALKNLQAEMVEKIEVFDKQSDIASFTGFYDGNEERTINVATKKGRDNGVFGRLYGGYGTDDYYESGGNINYFKGSRRISLIGLYNNINQRNFTMEDLSGSPSGGGMRHGGPRDSGGSMGGVSKTKAIGLNYSDMWGEKVEVTTSYFFNNSRNNSLVDSYREYFPTDGESHTYEGLYSSASKNNNHRFNMRLIYSIDSLNSIIFTPQLSWQNNNGFSLSEGTDVYNLYQIANSITDNDSKSNNFAVDGDLMFRHKFNKDRRTISVRVGTSSLTNKTKNNSYSLKDRIENDDDVLVTNQFADDSRDRYSLNTSLMFTEPISPKSMIMINYSPSFSKSTGNKEVYNMVAAESSPGIPDDLLSNYTTSNYIQQRGGLSFNYSLQNLNVVITGDIQNSLLKGNQTDPQSVKTEKHFNSFLPSMMIQYKKDRSTNFRLFYRTNTTSPSISQLQDVVDNSNTRLFSSGNPDLKQQYTHNLMFHFNTVNIKSSRTFFIMGGLTATSDYVATASTFASQDSLIANGIVLPKGTQFNKPVNLDGYFSARSALSYGFPLTVIKCNLNLNMNVNYQSKPGMFNYIKTKTDTYTLSGGVGLGSNISTNLDFSLSYNAGYNIIESTAVESTNYNYYNHSTSFDVNWIFLKRLVLNNSWRHTYYKGLGDDYDENYLIWNAGLGIKFLKDNKAEFRAKVYDLLNRNNSINRTISEAYVETSDSNIISRYLMFTFTYRLNSNKKPQVNDRPMPFGPPSDHGHGREGEGGPPPPPGGF